MSGDFNSLYQAFNAARQAGDMTHALKHIDSLIAASPRDPRHYFLRGMVLEDMRRPDEAVASLQDAIRLKPDYAEAYNNIGIILQDQKRMQDAIASFRDAIRLKPDYARAYNNLGISLRALGDLADARQQFEQAVRINPDYELAWFNLGSICFDSGQYGAAETSLAHVVRLRPDHAQALALLGLSQRQLGKLDEAQASLERAIRLRPGKNVAELDELAQVFWEQGKIERAIAAYRQAQELNPYDLKSAFGSLLSLPVVYRSREDLLATRERYAEGLQRLRDRIPDFLAHNQPERLLEPLRRNNFYLAYQGMDDKHLQVEYSGIVTSFLDSIAPRYMQPRPKREAGGRRLRIGFLSSFFRDCTAGKYFGSWITGLDRSRFEIFTYYTRPDADAYTREIADASDHFLHNVGNVYNPVRIEDRILEQDLDILVYPELGMDASSFLLASMRLAPVQCAGWGHPVTSGHANMDYYFSSAAMEPDNAAAHYSESLVLLDGIGTCYGKPVLPAAKRRVDFALPEGRTLYLCPQSLFKIHPDNDALLARVLERDPNGTIVLFAGRHPHITQTFFNRFTRALQDRGVDPKDRGVLLPYIDHDDYLRVNMLCDVMLDTLHWSGGNTSLDALACGLPLVTLPGEFMRGRQSYGMLKLIGLEELIARDQDDYVEIAARLGADPAWRAEVVRHIVASADAIFGKEAPLRQMERFYLSLYGM